MKSLRNILVFVSSFIPSILPIYAEIIWRIVDKAIMNFHIRHQAHVMKLLVRMFTGQILATGWIVRRSTPHVGEIFRNHPDVSWGPLTLLYYGYCVSFPGLQRSARGIDHIPPYTADVFMASCNVKHYPYLLLEPKLTFR